MGKLDFGLTAPAASAINIPPNDVANLRGPTRGVYVGTAGDLRVDMANGEDITFTNLAAGIIHPIRIIRVYATGTAAAGIIGLY